MEWQEWIIAIALTGLFAGCGVVLARRKNRSGFGWGLWGALFAPALFLLLVLPRKSHPFSSR